MHDPRMPSPFDDLEVLVQRARSGDPSASGALIEHYRDPLLARIRLLMGDEARRVAESSDFLQETFVAALPALERFELRGSAQFLGWLTTIARNRIRQDVRRRHEQAFSTLSSSLSGRPQRDSESQVWFDELLRLAQSLEGLPADEQRVIEMHDLQGLSFALIGEQLGCSERHARRKHAQALLRLARELRRADPSA